jgi:hypothetical protein
MSEVLDRLADDLLSPAALADRGLFEREYVDRLRRRAAGTPYSQERAYRLWSMLLTELWARAFLDRRGAAPAHALPAVRRLEGGGDPAAAPAAPVRAADSPTLGTRQPSGPAPRSS